MNMLFRIHSNLYKFEEVLCVHEEIQEGLEIRSIDRSFAWQFASPQYHQPHEEWAKDLNNDEVE